MGADINLHVGANFLDSFPERVYRAAMMKLMNDKKMLGEKTGGGFYKFDAKRKASPNPDIKAVIAESRKVGVGDLGSISAGGAAYGACAERCTWHLAAVLFRFQRVDQNVAEAGCTTSPTALWAGPPAAAERRFMADGVA